MHMLLILEYFQMQFFYNIFIDNLMYEQDQTPSQYIASTNKHNIKFQLKLADNIRHFYNSKTKLFDEQLTAQYVKSATVFEKQLDEPLGFIKRTFAFLARIKTKHQFLVFQLQSGIYGSVDFYQGNRVVLRLGNKLTIIEVNEQSKRKEAVIVQKNEKPYMIKMQEMENGVTFGDFIKIIYEIAPENGFSQIKYNGSHFSKDLMKQLKKQKKGRGSIIRSKLYDAVVGFDLI